MSLLLVISESGKPLFSHSDEDVEETEIARICGLFSALYHSVEPSMGALRHLRSQRLEVSWLEHKPFLLVAVSKDTSPNLFVRLRLEYLWVNMIASYTTQLKSHYREGMDLALNKSAIIKCLANPQPMTAALAVVPLSPHVRDRITQMLLQACKKFQNIVCIAVVNEGRFVNLVQPSFRPLHTSDLIILLHSLSKTADSEWFPLCLPRFHSETFLHVYREQNIVVVTTHGDEQQLSSLKECSAFISTEIRHAFRDPANNDDTLLQRHLLDAENRLRRTTEAAVSENGAAHFILRYNAELRESRKRRKVGRVCQYTAGGEASRKTWTLYERLALRLRLAATNERECESACMRIRGMDGASKNHTPVIDSECLALRVVEESPLHRGLELIKESNGCYAAASDDHFELFATFEPTLSLEEVDIRVRRLVQKLLSDKDYIFIANPIAWKF